MRPARARVVRGTSSRIVAMAVAASKDRPSMRATRSRLGRRETRATSFRRPVPLPTRPVRGTHSDSSRPDRCAFAGARGVAMTSAAFAPPKAADCFNPKSSGASDGVARSTSRTRASSSSTPSPAAGGKRFLSIDAARASVSRTPAAPSACPIWPLKGITTGSASPKTLRIALASIASL